MTVCTKQIDEKAIPHLNHFHDWDGIEPDGGFSFYFCAVAEEGFSMLKKAASRIR